MVEQVRARALLLVDRPVSELARLTTGALSGPRPSGGVEPLSSSNGLTQRRLEGCISLSSMSGLQ